MIDLRPDHLDTVQRILAEHVPECEVRAFGSRAAWTAKDYSDLDLAVVGAGPLDWRTLGRLKEAFEESSLPMRVDVLDWHAIPDSFRQAIERGYVVIQQAPKQTTAGEWREVALGELSHRITKGTTPTTVGGRFTDTGIGFVKVESITSEGRIDVARLAHIDDDTNALLARSSLHKNDVLFTIAGTIGRVAHVQEDILPANTNQAVAIVRPNQNAVDPAFLYYSLREDARIQRAHSRVVQSVQANFSLSELSAIEIPLPPLPEQRVIAHVLGTLDDKIELNRRINETLEAMARALFKDWFVDFGPVRAKMAGREPYLPPDVWSLFPDRLSPSELGDIPAGWEVKALEEVAKVVKGRSYRSVDLRDSDVALVTLKSIKRGGGYSPDGLKPYTGDYQPEQVVKAGDMVVAQTDVTQAAEVIGRTARVSDSPDYRTLVASLDLLVARPAPPLTSPYLYGVLQGHEFHSHALARVNGTTVLHMQKNTAQEFRFPLPPIPVIDNFTRVVGPLVSKCDNNLSESRALATLRDALLPSLVSGSLRVTNGSDGGGP